MVPRSLHRFVCTISSCVLFNTLLHTTLVLIKLHCTYNQRNLINNDTRCAKLHVGKILFVQHYFSCVTDKMTEHKVAVQCSNSQTYSSFTYQSLKKYTHLDIIWLILPTLPSFMKSKDNCAKSKERKQDPMKGNYYILTLHSHKLLVT